MYISNVPVSRPNEIVGVGPDIDMNGFSWSNKIGIFFHVSDVSISQIKLPPMTRS
jgi:hypothetical protein